MTSVREAPGWIFTAEAANRCKAVIIITGSIRLYPYSGKLSRSLKKEPKLYLWDWSEVADEAARFENLLASHLLKLCHYLYDVHGFKAQLHFLRMADKREVDFICQLVVGAGYGKVEHRLEGAGKGLGGHDPESLRGRPDDLSQVRGRDEGRGLHCSIPRS